MPTLVVSVFVSKNGAVEKCERTHVFNTASNEYKIEAHPDFYHFTNFSFFLAARYIGLICYTK